MKLLGPKDKKHHLFIFSVLLLIIFSWLLKSWIVFYVIAVSVNFIIIFIVIKRTYIGFASSAWPNVTADDHELNIDTTYVNSTEKVSIDLKYSYRVKGKEYISHNLKLPFNITGSLSTLYKQARDIQNANLIKVYFSPHNPKLSVLYPGVSFLDILSLFAFFAFIPLEIIIIILLSKPNLIF